MEDIYEPRAKGTIPEFVETMLCGKVSLSWPWRGIPICEMFATITT
jgi:hypothetical protein